MGKIEEEREIGYDEERLFPLFSKVRDLWIIIRFYLVISFYQMAFAVISYCWSKHIRDCTDPNHKYHKYLQCNVITNIPAIDTWFWFVSRCFSYVVWLYPVIYIFFKASQKNYMESQYQIQKCYYKRNQDLNNWKKPKTKRSSSLNVNFGYDP